MNQGYRPTVLLQHLLTMLIIAFDYPIPKQSDLSALSFGDITITGDYGTTTTTGNNRLLLWLLLELPAIMGELAEFARNKRVKICPLEMAYSNSSSRFQLERRKKGLHLFDANQGLIALETEEYFFNVFKEAVDEFIRSHESKINLEEESSAELLDEFEDSYHAFCEAIGALAIPVNLAIR